MPKRKGNPSLVQLPMFDPVTINLNKGYETIIDPIDADLAQYGWYLAGSLSRDNAYATREFNNKAKRLHVVIMERVLGRPMQPGEEVDHIDGDKFNNRRSNLRVATRSQNMRNQRRGKKNTSGFKGVSWHQHAWMAQIAVGGKKVYLGLYDTPEEAHDAYCKAAVQYFGEFARSE